MRSTITTALLALCVSAGQATGQGDVVQDDVVAGVREALAGAQVTMQDCPDYVVREAAALDGVTAVLCAVNTADQDERTFREATDRAMLAARFPFEAREWTRDWILPEDGSLYRVVCRAADCADVMLRLVLYERSRFDTPGDSMTLHVIDPRLLTGN